MSYLLGSRILLVNNKEKQMVLCVGIGALANVVLNFILIKLYFEKGAALASVLSEVIVFFLYLMFSHKYFKLQGLHSFFEKMLISLSVMIIFLVFISLSKLDILSKTIFQIIGSIIIYFGLLALVKEENTISFLKSLCSRIRKKN